MKKFLLSLLTISLFMVSIHAQNVNESKVPAAVKKTFAQKFPGSIAKWGKEDNNYEAEFKRDGNNMSALFESNGNMLESEVDIKVSDLPSKVLAYVKEHYKGKSIKEGARITKANGTVNYEAEVDGKDVIFSELGNFIKEVKD
jgi:hypothetical protein